jgi:hypothetical protein
VATLTLSTQVHARTNLYRGQKPQPNFSQKTQNSSLSRLAQQRFEFAEELLDWVEIR